MAELNPAQRTALGKLETTSPKAKIHEIRWDKDFRSPKFMSGTLSEASEDDPEVIARRAPGAAPSKPKCLLAQRGEENRDDLYGPAGRYIGEDRQAVLW